MSERISASGEARWALLDKGLHRFSEIARREKRRIPHGVESLRVRDRVAFAVREHLLDALHDERRIFRDLRGESACSNQKPNDPEAS